MAFGLFGPKEGHPALYAELCKLHALDRKTKSLLDQMIQVLNMKQPSLLFVDVSWFQKAIARPEFSEQADALREISFKWFGRRI